jgi:hypothetical protein
MELTGTVQNGVIVLSDGATLPEGTNVTVTLAITPEPNEGAHVKTTMVNSERLGTLFLTNETIKNTQYQGESAVPQVTSETKTSAKYRNCCGTKRGKNKPHLDNCPIGQVEEAKRQAQRALLPVIRRAQEEDAAEQNLLRCRKKAIQYRRSKLLNPIEGKKPPDPKPIPLVAPGGAIDTWRET